MWPSTAAGVPTSPNAPNRSCAAPPRSGCYSADDRHHAEVRAVLEAEPGPVILPTVILAELDYLLRAHLGVKAELDFVEGILAGAYTLDHLTKADLIRSAELIAKYRALDLGLADASVMATAERLGLERILTLDERDFRTVRSRRGQPFILLPADRPGK